MEIPTIYTVEEAAQLLKASPQAILDEIEAGRLEAFRLGTEWRTTDKGITDFISRGGSQTGVTALARQRLSHLELQKAEAFSYTWPDGGVEEYPEAYEGTVSVDNKQVAVKIGIGERHAAGKNRKRVIVILNGRPTVEFAGVDDFDKSHLVASVVTLPNRKRLKPRQPVPDEYRYFHLVRYDAVVTGPRAMSVMAVVARIDDFDTMVSHAVTRAVSRDQL